VLPARDSLTDVAAAASSSGRQHCQLQAAEAEAREPHWDLGVYQVRGIRLAADTLHN
jgi:hypothetical protein